MLLDMTVTKKEIYHIVSFGDEDWHEIFTPLQHIDVGALFICIISIVLMLVWDKPFFKKRFKFIPGAFVAVIVSIIFNEIFKATGNSLAVGSDHLVQIKVAGSASEFFSFFTFPDF